MYLSQILCSCVDLNTSSRFPCTLSKACLRSTKHKNSGLNSITFSISCLEIYMTSVLDRLCRKPCCSSCILNLFTIFPTMDLRKYFQDGAKQSYLSTDSWIFLLFLLKYRYRCFSFLRYYSCIYNFPEKSCDLPLNVWSSAF
jgi:hypothetical protein